jgi:hypothetical protein
LKGNAYPSPRYSSAECSILSSADPQKGTRDFLQKNDAVYPASNYKSSLSANLNFSSLGHLVSIFFDKKNGKL